MNKDIHSGFNACQFRDYCRYLAKRNVEHGISEQQLKRSLDECLSLAAAWAGYYSTAPQYGMDGTVHPQHQAIIERAKALLK